MDIETIKKIELGPNDTIVLECASNLSLERIEQIKNRAVEAWGPDRNVVILTQGISLKVVSPTE